MNWTPDMDRMLAECAAKGMTTREIAAALNERFGTAFTKNSIISRSQRTKTRLGLRFKPDGNVFYIGQAGPKKPIEHRATPKREARPTPIIAKPPIPKRETTMQQYSMRPTWLDDDTIEPPYVSLLALKPRQCRFPIGHDNYHFCGAPVTGETSWCAEHYSLVYRDKSAERMVARYRALRAEGL